MSAKDYSIIQGFPGTGKTSTIVFIVRLLVALGKRVLVTSYTHAAVDNILLKLMEHGVGPKQNSPINTDLVRIGPKSACHPNLHRVLASELAGEIDRHDFVQGDTITQTENDDTMPSVSSLNQVLCAARVVGVSALTMPKTPLLIGQDFDVVIVDEAGQINQPACIGAVMGADSFLLVGDHEQLPPLVQNDAAGEAGKNFEELLILCFIQVFYKSNSYRIHYTIQSRLWSIIIEATRRETPTFSCAAYFAIPNA